MYETNEEMFPVIEAGGIAYDAVCPSDFMIQKMREHDLLAEINFDNVPNLKEIDPLYLELAQSFDPENKYAVPFIFVILMGLIQFPMPYIGNGAADISKQLFLFNISFDFGLTVLIYMLFKTVSKKLSKKISKNS